MSGFGWQPGPRLNAGVLPGATRAVSAGAMQCEKIPAGMLTRGDVLAGSGIRINYRPVITASGYVTADTDQGRKIWRADQQVRIRLRPQAARQPAESGNWEEPAPAPERKITHTLGYEGRYVVR